MWTCKHCSNTFDFANTSQKANHVRWCDSNPSKKTWDSGKGTLTQYGELRSFQVVCSTCSTDFEVEEREKTFPRQDKYYCSRSCACSEGGKAKALKHHPDETAHYRTVAARHNEKKCLVCGFDNFVHVHHVDEDHSNNDPKNLVYLCPNHHMMLHHTGHHEEIGIYIEEYIQTKWAVSDKR